MRPSRYRDLFAIIKFGVGFLMCVVFIEKRSADCLPVQTVTPAPQCFDRAQVPVGIDFPAQAAADCTTGTIEGNQCPQQPLGQSIVDEQLLRESGGV